MALAHTGANTGLLATGILLLAFGGLVMLGLRRKRA
jgi:LPXTG-motif cell wall-anchored protein